MKIAIHQPNFIPNFPFFYKMAMADLFVILKEVDFEKNNYQNRYLLNNSNKWVTKSIVNGNDQIWKKKYTDGQYLTKLNMDWIWCIRNTLSIKTDIVFDYPTCLRKTERLVDIIKHYGGDTYITNPSAKSKYLDEELMRSSGINIEYCNVPKHLQKHIFEIFEQYGIDGAIKQLPKRKAHEINTAVVSVS